MTRILYSFLVLLLMGTTTCFAQAAPGDTKLATLEGLVRTWVELRKEIAAESHAWQEGQEHLEAEIYLLENEKANLGSEIEETSEAEAFVQADRVKTLKDQERLSTRLSELRPIITRAEASLRRWPDRIPPPLVTPLLPAFDALPASGQASGESIGARLQRVLALYADIERLQNELHVVKKVLLLPGGKRREVDVLYLGLARAFAVSPNDDWAGIGFPGKSGWTWNNHVDLSASIRSALNIAQHEQVAELAVLPLAISEGAK